MPVYKDKERNTWYCRFYYTSWDGKRKRSTKRGFITKREALQWEREYVCTTQRKMTMTLKTFVDLYFEDKKGELKERTVQNKKRMIDVHVVPYLGEKRMCDIVSADLIQWQNIIRGKKYSATYLRMIQNQITALFTHACNIYGLSDNPCKKIKKMGKSNVKRLDFWTKEEYDTFIATIDKESKYYVLFEILFWTGCRIGEALALTEQDFDFEKKQMSIVKTFYRTEGKNVITAPKTEASIRVIDIPEFLAEEVQGYVFRCLSTSGERMFPITHEAVQHKMKRHIKKAGVRKIRVHGLRHSHVSYLIDLGVEPLIIKERLGHEDIKITLNTYGHLYPSKQRLIADLLDKRREGGRTVGSGRVATVIE